MSWTDLILPYDEVTSTMDVASALAADGAAEGTTVVARHQTDGRGRRGRTWGDVPGGSLLATTILRPAGAELDARLSLLTAVAIGDALDEVGCTAFSFKWPNDVLVASGKLAGVLLYAGQPQGVVLLGYGVNLAPATLAPSIEVSELPYAGLADMMGGPPSAAAVGKGIVAALEARVVELRTQGAGALLAAYRTRDALFGRSIEFEQAGQPVSGVADGVTEDGALRVETRSGTLTVTTGEVRKVRPR